MKFVNHLSLCALSTLLLVTTAVAQYEEGRPVSQPNVSQPLNGGFYNSGPTAIPNQDRRERNSVPNGQPSWSFTGGQSGQQVIVDGRGHHQDRGYYDERGRFHYEKRRDHHSQNHQRNRWQNINGQWVRVP